MLIYIQSVLCSLFDKVVESERANECWSAKSEWLDSGANMCVVKDIKILLIAKNLWCGGKLAWPGLAEEKERKIEIKRHMEWEIACNSNGAQQKGETRD